MIVGERAPQYFIVDPATQPSSFSSILQNVRPKDHESGADCGGTAFSALLIQFHKPYEINQVPVPTPNGKDVLIKIGAASYCHTDYVAAAGDFPGTKLPQIPSHEGCGTIAQVGPDVPEGKFKVGDRVAVAGHYRPCCNITI